MESLCAAGRPAVLGRHQVPAGLGEPPVSRWVGPGRSVGLWVESLGRVPGEPGAGPAGAGPGRVSRSQPEEAAAGGHGEQPGARVRGRKCRGCSWEPELRGRVMPAGRPRELGGACFQGFPFPLQLIDRQGYVSPRMARLSCNPPAPRPARTWTVFPGLGASHPVLSLHLFAQTPLPPATSTMWMKPGLWQDTGALFLFYSMRFQKL